MKNGAARGQLSLDEVGGTGRGRGGGSAARLRPCTAIRGNGGFGCSGIGER
jgi:hypothetical protein